MGKNLFTVVGIMSVDGVFLEKVYPPATRDAALHDAGIQLTPPERAKLDQIISSGGLGLKKELIENGTKYFCPNWPHCPWPIWPATPTDPDAT